MLRNTLVMHAPVPVTTSVGLALRAGNHDEVWVRSRDAARSTSERTASYSATLARAGEAAADAQAGDDGVRFAALTRASGRPSRRHGSSGCGAPATAMSRTTSARAYPQVRSWPRP